MSNEFRRSPAARNSLAVLMRRFYTGRITNWQFEDQAVDFTEADTAAHETFWHGAWTTYSDNREYRFTDRETLTPDKRRMIARWILFLKSGQECKGGEDYKWPRSRRMSAPLAIILILSGLPLAWWTGRWEFSVCGFWLLMLIVIIHFQIERRRLFKGRDCTHWPFANAEDYAEALRHPPFLAGKPSPR